MKVTKEDKVTTAETWVVIVGVIWGAFSWFIVALKADLIFDHSISLGAVVGVEMGGMSLIGKILVLPALISFKIYVFILMTVAKIFWIADIYWLSILLEFFINFPISVVFGVVILQTIVVVIQSVIWSDKSD